MNASEDDESKEGVSVILMRDRTLEFRREVRFHKRNTKIVDGSRFNGVGLALVLIVGWCRGRRCRSRYP